MANNQQSRTALTGAGARSVPASADRGGYYQLKTKDLVSLNVGTAVPSLTVEVLNEVTIDLPSLKRQEQVVTLVDSLENKIILNNRLNDYLAA